MSKAQTKKGRATIKQVVGTVLPPSRVSFHCENFINFKFEQEYEDAQEKLEKLKKKDVEAPAHPERLKAKASTAETERHKKEMDKYKEEYAAYKASASEDYQKAKTIADVVLRLERLHGLLTQEGKQHKNEKLSESEAAAVKHLQMVLSDELIPKRAKEDDDAFAARRAAFAEHPTAYAKYTKDTDLNDPESVQELVDALKVKPHVELFLSLAELSGERPRSSAPVFVCITAAVEAVVGELVSTAMRNLSDRIKDARRLDPQILGCDPAQLENLHFWALARDSPHMRALVAREQRRIRHEAAVRELARRHARVRIRNRKLGVATAPFSPQSFDDEEVLGGFARKQVILKEKKVKGSEGVTKTVEVVKYFWRGIDQEYTPDEEKAAAEHNFVHYIHAICEMKRDEVADTEENGEELLKSKISKKFTAFMSDVVIDVIRTIALQLDIRMHPRGEKPKTTKTIKYGLVIDVVRQVLVLRHGELTAPHKKLFTDMEAKVEKLKEHKTALGTKASAVPNGKPASAAAAVAAAAEESPPVKPKPAAKAGAGAAQSEAPKKAAASAIESDDEDDDDDDDDEDSAEAPVPKTPEKSEAPKAAASPAAKTPSRAVARK
jgi:hypothetical protein